MSRKLRILIDGRTVRENRTGVGYYTESFIRALDKVSAEFEFSVLTLDPGAWDPPLSRIQLLRVSADYEAHPANEFFLNFTIPGMLRRENFSTYWCPAFVIPWAPTSVRKIVTIHDLTVFTHRQFYPWRFAAYMRFAQKLSVRSADLVICDSKTVASEIERIMPGLAQRVEVIPAAADPFFSPGEDTQKSADVLPRAPYALLTGYGDPRKDGDTVIEAFQILRSEQSIPHVLVVVGKLPTQELEGVVFLPRQSREALRALYRHADLYVYASAYEGFGLPVLEAMSCGCPVLASAVGAIPETGGDAALYFEPGSSADAAEKMLEILGSQAKRTELRDVGLRRAAAFSWERSAGLLLKLLEEL